MKRKERRRVAKQHKVHFKLLTPDDGKQPDHTSDEYCWLHPKAKDPAKDKLTAEDKNYLESIRLVPTKTIDKDGTIILGRACKRCHNSIRLEEKPTQNLPGYTTKWA